MNDFFLERYLKYPFVFLVGFLVTSLLTPLVRRLAPRFGLVDMPGERRIHKTPIPRCGISVFLGFHAACASVFLFPWLPFGAQLKFDWWWHFLIVSSVLLVVGLIDDARGLRPLVKLAGQILAASLAFAFDMRVGNILGFALPPILDYVATLVWFLALMNAFNLIDGIDGLATGLAAIAAAGIAGSFLFRHVPGDALVLFGFMGACLAFLRYNFQPASIFLGDSGSLFLGLTLAAISTGTGAKGTALTAIGVPLLAVGIPLLDTLLAIWRRTARRFHTRHATGPNNEPRRIFQGDTDHLHHRLVRTGMSHRATATALYLLNGALVTVGLLSIIFRSQAVGIYTLAFVAFAYVAVRFLAGTELWDSGVAISEGIRRPGNRTLSILLAPLWDLAALAAALAIACVAALRDYAGVEMSRFWFDQLPLWVGVPFLFLALTRTYRRVWSRARPSEHMLLAVTLVAGIFAAAGLSIVSSQPHPPMHVFVMNLDGPGIPSIVMGQGATHHWLLWQTVMYIGCALPLILGTRQLPRIIQDAVGWAGGRRRASDRTSISRGILLYGAGYAASTYLVERSFAPTSALGATHVVGLMDDDPLLYRRYVGGHPVLGNIENLATILATRRIDEIVVTTQLHPDILSRLLAMAAEHRVTVTAWRTTTTPLYTPSAS